MTLTTVSCQVWSPTANSTLATAAPLSPIASPQINNRSASNKSIPPKVLRHALQTISNSLPDDSLSRTINKKDLKYSLKLALRRLYLLLSPPAPESPIVLDALINAQRAILCTKNTLKHPRDPNDTFGEDINLLPYAKYRLNKLAESILIRWAMNKFFVSLFILTSSFYQGYSQDNHIEHVTLPLYFWDARPTQGFANFGDALSEVLVDRMLGYKVHVVENPFDATQKLLGMGSILSYANDNDIIWGTGINGKSPPSAYRFTQLDVRAVRGPLTRKFLLERGIPCPEIYGDPTLLFPICFPEFKKKEHPSKEYIVIPHYSDEYLFLDEPNMVSAKENWEHVINSILDSKFVISSALSGVIVAEAFGIPARLLIVANANNTENLVKYEDYYFGTHRFSFRYATTIEEALKMGGEPLPICDLQKLFEAFPFDFFPSAFR